MVGDAINAVWYAGPVILYEVTLGSDVTAGLEGEATVGKLFVRVEEGGLRLILRGAGTSGLEGETGSELVRGMLALPASGSTGKDVRDSMV